jgi:hypothetical protein
LSSFVLLAISRCLLLAAVLCLVLFVSVFVLICTASEAGSSCHVCCQCLAEFTAEFTQRMHLFVAPWSPAAHQKSSLSVLDSGVRDRLLPVCDCVAVDPSLWTHRFC